MALRLIKPPGVSDLKNFRARESFDQALESMLKFVATITVNVGSINGGAVGTFTVPVEGVRADLGMTVQVGVPSTHNTGLIPWGFVSADNVVTVVLSNSTAAPINPPDAIYAVRVMP